MFGEKVKRDGVGMGEKRAGEEKKEYYSKRNGGRGRKGGDGSKGVM